MTEPEAKNLKMGDRVVYRLGDQEFSRGTVTNTYPVAFKVVWDDGGESQMVNYNEAHYIFPVPDSGREA